MTVLDFNRTAETTLSRQIAPLHCTKTTVACPSVRCVTVSRAQSAPLYEQVRQRVLAQIADGTYAAGDRLPSEAALGAELGVHRLTVRRALEELAREGVVIARQGSGTYVVERSTSFSIAVPLTAESLSPIINAEIGAHGTDYRDILITATVIDDPARSRDLALPEVPLAQIESRVDVGGETWVCSTSWVPALYVPLIEKTWRQTDGLYGQLLEQFSELTYVWRSFAAEAASPEDAAAMGIKPGTPVVVREGLTAAPDGTPILRVRRRGRMDRIKYIINYTN